MSVQLSSGNLYIFDSPDKNSRCQKTSAIFANKRRNLKMKVIMYKCEQMDNHTWDVIRSGLMQVQETLARSEISD